MEQHSPPNAKSSDVLEAQVRECYGRVVYSHKTHEKCSDILLARLSTIKLWQIVLSALTTGGFLALALWPQNVGSYVGVIASTILLVLNVYTKDYDLGELAQKHKNAANDLWLVRERYLSLLTDLRVGDFEVVEIRSKRDGLLEELHNAYAGSPATNFKAYQLAQESLKNADEMTFSDSEINAFLPSQLHRN